MRKLPGAAAGMAVTVAMVGGPKSPMRNSGREPSTAIASLGQVRAAAAGTGAAEVGKTMPQSVVTPQWLHDQIESNSQIKVSF